MTVSHNTTIIYTRKILRHLSRHRSTRFIAKSPKHFLWYPWTVQDKREKTLGFHRGACGAIFDFFALINQWFNENVHLHQTFRHSFMQKLGGQDQQRMMIYYAFKMWFLWDDASEAILKDFRRYSTHTKVSSNLFTFMNI